jgi:phosphoribosylglycinamide formyltransferase 1
MIVFLEKNSPMKNIAVFASGSGTNCESMIHHFANSDVAEVCIVVTNNPFAGVIERAENLDVDCFINLFQTNDDLQTLFNVLEEYQVDWIVLAGFLKLIPHELISRFPNRIINIHPALLPKFGGKGMYGMNVHKAVLSSGDVQSGISIHYVNEKYDEGKIIAQFTCPVLPNDTPEKLAERIHELEYRHFSVTVEEEIKRN